MLLSQLLKNTDVQSAYDDREISFVTDNSNKVREGCAFVCVKGARFDGHAFASKAVKNGAVAIIAFEDTGLKEQILTNDTRKAYAEMCKNLFECAVDSITVIGVTGTNGKTTTAFVIKDILHSLGIESGLIGTVQNMIGDKAFHTELTTPDPYDMHKLFYDMHKSGVKYCVMETSSQALHQMRLSGVKFKVGVFTNLTQDHLDYHGTFDEYKRCKKMLFEASENVVVNADDDASSYMTSGIKADVLTYSVKNSSDFKAKNINYHKDRVNYQLDGKNVDFYIPGGFSVYNSLAAITAVRALGFLLDDILNAVPKAHAVPGRIELLKTDTDYSVIIDYAHTPDGLEKVIGAVRGFTDGRVITVFGCGGDRDKNKRPKMGKTVTKLADIAVVTTDNPRTEEPDAIIKDILPGTVGNKAEVVAITDRSEAIAYAMSIAKKGDTVLLAGKGHETYQVIGRERIHYDEREVVASVLKKGE